MQKKNIILKALVHGGIKSKFQKEKFENLCSKLDLIAIAPLWDTEPKQYLE